MVKDLGPAIRLEERHKYFSQIINHFAFVLPFHSSGKERSKTVHLPCFAENHFAVHCGTTTAQKASWLAEGPLCVEVCQDQV